MEAERRQGGNAEDPTNSTEQEKLTAGGDSSQCVSLEPSSAQFVRKITAAPVFVIDLDREPEERWNQVIDHFADRLHKLQDYLQTVAVEDFGGKFWGPVVAGLAQTGLSKTYSIPSHLRREMEGIAKRSGKLGFKELVILNLGYECMACCTSIVAQDEYGRPFHLRNLDWDFDLADITFEAHFVKAGKLLFRTTTHAGFVGVFTGMREGNHENNEGFSISINYRKLGPAAYGLVQNVWNLVKGGKSLSFLVREALETRSTYNEALDFVKKTPLVAPSYIIIAGTCENEGALITRNRDKDIEQLELSEEQPYLVQTNTDHWVDHVDGKWAQGDMLLLNSIERRELALSMIANLREQARVGDPNFIDESLNLLFATPVCNVETIYSVIMCPGYRPNSASSPSASKEDGLGSSESLPEEEQSSCQRAMYSSYVHFIMQRDAYPVPAIMERSVVKVTNLDDASAHWEVHLLEQRRQAPKEFYQGLSKEAGHMLQTLLEVQPKQAAKENKPEQEKKKKEG
ncbi:MFS domain-containing protein [Balamuthia mandrillaris]